MVSDRSVTSKNDTLSPYWDEACKWAAAYCQRMFGKEWHDDSIAHEYMAARNGYLAAKESVHETSPHLSSAELLIPATRYYIGRMTIHTTVHAQALARGWHSIPQNVRNVIRTDLEDAFRRDDAMRADPVCSSSYYPLGGDVDREAWEEVRKAWLANPSAVETSTELPEGLRDPIKVMERVRAMPSESPLAAAIRVARGDVGPPTEPVKFGEKASRDGLCREGFSSGVGPCILKAGHKGICKFTPNGRANGE